MLVYRRVVVCVLHWSQMWHCPDLPRHMECQRTWLMPWLMGCFAARPSWKNQTGNLGFASKVAKNSQFCCNCYDYLVGGIPTPPKNMTSSVGIIIPNWMESHKIHVPNHKPGIIIIIAFFIWQVVDSWSIYWKNVMFYSTFEIPHFWWMSTIFLFKKKQ